MPIRIYCSLILLACSLGMVSRTHAANTEQLVLAVHPFLPVAEINERFTPLAEYLTTATGLKVTVRVGQDYQEHIEAIGKDRVDIAFMGPAPYVKMVEKFGPKPLLARFEVNHAPQLFGAIVARTDGPIQSIADIKGRRFAFGDPESTMSHYVPRFMLSEAGIETAQLADHKFLGSHKNVALAVLASDFDAGAVKYEVFEEYAPQGLRLIAKTPPVSDHLFVTRGNLPAAKIEKLRQALLSLKDAPAGPDIMNKLHKGMTALIAVSDADYDNLRPMVKHADLQAR